MNVAQILGCGLLVSVMLSAQDHGDKSLAARVQRLEDEAETGARWMRAIS